MAGWISLHRSLLDHKLWKAEPFTKGQAWVDILLLTNHSDQFMTVKNGTMVEIKRGECGYSELALADRWKWSRGKVGRFVKTLASQKMIHQKKVENRTIIVVCNYEEFQTDSKQNSKRTLNGTVNGHLTDTNNKENNENHETMKPEEPMSDKSDDAPKKAKKHFIPPSVLDVATYCAERKNTVDPEAFVNFYESKGWVVGKNKMKSWQAAVRTWEKNSFGGSKNTITKVKKVDYGKAGAF